ncbi:MAG: amidohydrolase family protein [Gemmatimonadaceae bacterium]
MIPRASQVVLENARIVHHDRCDARPLAFAGGRIVAAAASGTPHRIDLSDHLILPGLINAHDHLQLNAIPPLAHAEPFASSYEWIDAFEAHRERDDVAAAAAVPKATRLRHGALKNLLAGTTTVAHHDPWDAVFDEPTFPVHVVRRFQWAHSLKLGASCDGAPPRYGPAVRESFAAAAADEPWIIHLAEGTDEIANRELATLDAMGCLESNTVIVHGVGLTGADVDKMISRDASVIWCPSSNRAMLGRTLGPHFFAAVGRLALGTDSRLTGASDLLDELRCAAASSRLSARELLRIVTADAARVLRVHEPRIEPGAPADCLILHATGDPYATLLGAQRSRIRAVVRGGSPMIADPDFRDWFAHAGIPTCAARLDGRPKLVAEWIARPEVAALEPGLELVGHVDA